MQFVIAKGYKCFDLNTVFKEISINNCKNFRPKNDDTQNCHFSKRQSIVICTTKYKNLALQILTSILVCI